VTITLEEGEGILWITVESGVVGKWYRDVKKTKTLIRYEDAVQNYLLNHLKLLRTEEMISFWVEDKLRTSEKDKTEKRKYRPDVIVEYADQIWLIEVKGHNAELTDVFQSRQPTPDKPNRMKPWTAVWQVGFYERRLRSLEWWGVHKDETKSKRKIQKVVFWCHREKLSKREIKRIPIDLDEMSKWPVCR